MNVDHTIELYELRKEVRRLAHAHEGLAGVVAELNRENASLKDRVLALERRNRREDEAAEGLLREWVERKGEGE